MLFVPLPLFASLCLFGVLVHMLATRDVTMRSNQLFVLLVGLYTLQSVLLCLRWGYGVEAVAMGIAYAAPVLPIVAFFAYLSLAEKLTIQMLWPLSILVLNWALLALVPDLADAAIMMTYLSFGAVILFNTFGARGSLGLVRIGQVDGALFAMRITGAALISSAVADLYVFIDFIQTGGQNIGFAISLLQTGFLLVIGLAALLGEVGASAERQSVRASGLEAAPSPRTEEDDSVMQRLKHLFEVDHLHQDTELSLRRISRRLSLPDRSVSQAINRTTNLSVSQYVNGFRIKDACKLLESTEQTILQVSLASGFLTKSNFNREFARVMQQTPSAWRKATRQGD